MRAAKYIVLGPINLPYSPFVISLIFCLCALVMATAFLALNVGTTGLTHEQLLSWIISFGQNGDIDVAELMALRAPRVGVAVLGGAMLAASGYLLQVASGNALADPGLLGLSQGTSAFILLGSIVFNLPTQWLASFGLIGGLLAAALVLLLAFYLRLSNGLILIGIATGIILSSLTEIVIVAGGIERYASYVIWSHGSLTATSAIDVAHLAIWAGVVTLPLLMATRAIGPLELGNDQAASLGISPRLTRLLLTVLATALVAPVVAIVGPISFLGLISSHIARRMVGAKPGEVLPITMLIGMIVVLIADLAGRTLFNPVIIPAGLIISILGVFSFLSVAAFARISKQ